MGLKKVGWVGYSHYYPVAYHLRTSLDQAGLSWMEGVPRQINELLQQSNLMAALSSSVCELVDECVPLMDYGVSCDGPVKSVYLGMVDPDSELIDALAQKAAEFNDLGESVCQMSFFDLRARLWKNKGRGVEGPPLRLGLVSQTSATLAQIFYGLWFGQPNRSHEYHPQGDDQPPFQKGQFYLMIGDDALRWAQHFDFKVDLCEAWKDLTGLPFVFARWLTHRRFLSHHHLDVIRQCVKHSIQAAEQDISEYESPSQISHIWPGGDRDFYDNQIHRHVDLKDYLQRITYRLGSREKQSSQLFLSWAQQINL